MREPEMFTIGSLATAAGVTVETIRFYQRERLLREPPKPPGTIRRYGAADLARLQFIKAAQRLGFALNDISELLSLDDGTGCSVARQRAEKKLVEVREKLANLQRMESALADLVARCAKVKGTMRCPLIEQLAR